MDYVKPFFRVTVIAETGIREKGDGEREKKEWSLQTGGGRRESGDGGASGARRRAAKPHAFVLCFRVIDTATR